MYTYLHTYIQQLPQCASPRECSYVTYVFAYIYIYIYIHTQTHTNTHTHTHTWRGGLACSNFLYKCHQEGAHMLQNLHKEAFISAKRDIYTCKGALHTYVQKVLQKRRPHVANSAKKEYISAKRDIYKCKTAPYTCVCIYCKSCDCTAMTLLCNVCIHMYIGLTYIYV